MKEIKGKQSNEQSICENPNEDFKKPHSLILPCSGLKGEHFMNSLRGQLYTKLPEKSKAQTYFTCGRLSSLFQSKDNTKKEDEQDIVYHLNCSKESCEDNYIG